MRAVSPPQILQRFSLFGVFSFTTSSKERTTWPRSNCSNWKLAAPRGKPPGTPPTKTLGALILRVADYDEAAHANYALYALPGVADADKALAFLLIDLLLDVPEQSLQSDRALSIYRTMSLDLGTPGLSN